MGSTNAMRVLGWKWGLLTQVLDILKGIIAVVIATQLFNGTLPISILRHLKI